MDLYRFNTLRGLIYEGVVWETLTSDKPWYHLEQASKEDNIKHDIDIWLNGEACSIKTQHKGIETGNFSFELEQQLPTGEWVREQGYHKSHAERYLIVQGTKLYNLRASEVQWYVKRHGWDREVTLSEALKESQEGKRYIDARSGLIARTALVRKETYHISPELLHAAQQLVIACEHIDTECLRDPRAIAATLRLLVTCYAKQENKVARSNILGYARNILSLTV